METVANVIKLQHESIYVFVNFFVKKHIDTDISMQIDMEDNIDVLKNNQKMDTVEIVEFISKVKEKFSFEIKWEENYRDEGLWLTGYDVYDWFDAIVKLLLGDDLKEILQIGRAHV